MALYLRAGYREVPPTTTIATPTSGSIRALAALRVRVGTELPDAKWPWSVPHAPADRTCPDRPKVCTEGAPSPHL